jgi:hypothetical protein
MAAVHGQAKRGVRRATIQRRRAELAAVAITGRYLLGLLPMGGVPFTTAGDRQDGGRHGVFSPSV